MTRAATAVGLAGLHAQSAAPSPSRESSHLQQCLGHTVMLRRRALRGRLPHRVYEEAQRAPHVEMYTSD